MNGNLLLCLLWIVTTRRASQSRTGTRTTVLWSWTWAKPLWRSAGRRSRGHLRRRPATARFLHKGHLVLTFDATRRDCLPAVHILLRTIFQQWEAVSRCRERSRRNTQQDKNSPLPGKRKTRTTFAMVIGYLRDMEGSKKVTKFVVVLLCTVVLFCSVCKKCQLFPCHVPFVCVIVLSNNQWSLWQRSVQFKIPYIFSISEDEI